MMPNPIQLKVPFHIRLLSVIFSIAGYYVTFLYFPSDMLLLGLIMWTWFVVRGIFYSPEMTIHPHGIETRRLWWRHFTTWDEVLHVRFGELNSQIYPNTLHPFVRGFVYNNLMIMAWRENYKEAIAYLKSKLEERENRSQRAYE